MLDLEVIPNFSLSGRDVEFYLGMPINQVIAGLRNISRANSTIEINYDAEKPLSQDIQIRLVKDGILLHFEPETQLLRFIEVYDLSNVILRCSGTIFSQPDDEATITKLENCFGSTRPAVYDDTVGLYELNWDGLSFCFRHKSSSSAVLTLNEPGVSLSSKHFKKSLPSTCKIIIFKGVYSSPIIPSIPQDVFCGMVFNKSVETVLNGSRITGLKFDLFAEKPNCQKSRDANVDIECFTQTILLGDSVESVMAKLGAPSEICQETEVELRSRIGTLNTYNKQPNYFFIYFSIGLDVVFDGASHRVIEFVMHTNLPGHYDFGIYNRCNFKLHIVGEEKWSLTPSSEADDFLVAFSSERDSPVKPVALNHRIPLDESNGSTLCFGSSQFVIEVMPCGLIATVAIF